MNLKARLSRLQAQTGAGVDAPAQKPALSTLRERIAQLETSGRSQTFINNRSAASPALPVEELARKLDGELISEGLIRIRKRLPLDGKLGSVALQAVSRQPCLPGEKRDTGQRNVYLDTETTGLSGGSGTLVFLAGFAVVEKDAIEMSQFLITRFAAEAAMLSAVAETLTSADRLVSYNGRSYDLPLLITRYRMQALAHPFDGLPHLDLLHPVRRLFSRRWDNCRLTSLEENLLGFRRVDDLPGSEAPAAWFGYVRHGHGGPLARVVEHHRQDIVSLAVAHSTLMQAIEQPQAFDVDLHALARWQLEDDEDAARELLHLHADTLCEDGQRLLGRLSRRAGHWPQAVTIWEALAARGCTDSMERLAKYHEHISKDLAAARHCCSQLPEDTASRHRRRRIDTKLRRQKEDGHIIRRS